MDPPSPSPPPPPQVAKKMAKSKCCENRTIAGATNQAFVQPTPGHHYIIQAQQNITPIQASAQCQHNVPPPTYQQCVAAPMPLQVPVSATQTPPSTVQAQAMAQTTGEQATDDANSQLPPQRRRKKRRNTNHQARRCR